MAICTGCSLLCEDIELTVKDGDISHVRNLCRKGHGHYQALLTERARPMIDGKEVALDQAIAKAAEVLHSSKAPLLCGWSNATLEAQAAGMSIAKKLGASICDTSPPCLGALMERIISGRIPTCTLDDVRNFADVSVFWGSDPSNSHPRHLSRFSYYPRGEKRQKSYEEERTCIAVDVRKSATATLCSNYYFRMQPGGDGEFIESILATLDGRIPKFGDKKRMIELGSIIKKTEYGVIFPGPAMLISLQDQMDRFEELFRRLNDITTFKVVPMTGQYNSRGFCQLLFERTGRVKRVKFAAEGSGEAEKALEAIRAYAERLEDNLVHGVGILLYGPSGTGKDHLLAALAKLAAASGKWVKRITGPELFRLMRDAMADGEESARVEGLKYPPVLILSDPLPPVGVLTPYQAAVLYELVDHRWQNRLPVWCSLNVASSQEADQRLGAAIVDRLQDGALVIRCGWPSYRRPRVVT